MELVGYHHAAFGNCIKKCFKECDITLNQQTRTWEGNSVSPAEAAKQLKQVFEYLAEPQKIPGKHRGMLDRIWIYIDRAKD